LPYDAAASPDAVRKKKVATFMSTLDLTVGGRAPVPPTGGCWDWPLSRGEKMVRIVLVDRKMTSLDHSEHVQELEGGVTKQACRDDVIFGKKSVAMFAGDGNETDENGKYDDGKISGSSFCSRGRSRGLSPRSRSFVGDAGSSPLLSRSFCMG
jgi:hypothetical protein